MEENNHSDHSSAAAEEDAPVLTPSSSEEEERRISIRRSTYASDVEENDNSKNNDDDNSSPVIYTGSTTHGIFHAIDSTSKQPAMHVWLDDIRLWPATVNHYLRSTSYDTFTFTPFSSKENWNKMNPESKSNASITPKGSSTKKPSSMAAAASSSPTKSVTKNLSTNKKSHLMRNNDKHFLLRLDYYLDNIFSGSLLSIIIKICLFVCVAYIMALLVCFIGYAIGYFGYLYTQNNDGKTVVTMGALKSI